jgi:hypothetical protein
MKPILQLVSFVGLGLTIIPAFLVYAGTIAWETHATLMLVGTLVWFGAAPFWMRARSDTAAPAEE